MTEQEILRRLRVLQDYQGSLHRINEQSDAADREELRVMLAISKLNKVLREARAARSGVDAP